MSLPFLRRPGFWIGLMLLAGTLGLYSPVRHHEFLNFDDDRYVTRNLFVRDGFSAAGVRIACLAVYASNWHPLTWFSHMLDCELFGLKAGGHHLTNLLFHTLNALLLYGLLNWMTRAPWRSGFVAALFAWHPLHIESVAWIAERKDVLSTFFGLLCLGSYARYVEFLRAGGARRRWWYCAAWLLLLLGLLSKPMLVTLPAVMMLLDIWPLKRTDLGLPTAAETGATWRDWLWGFGRSAREKIPFFLLSAGSSVVTFVAQHASGSVATVEHIPVAARLANALIAYATYLAQTVWPSHLAVFYPHPVSWPAVSVLISAALLVLLSLLALREFRRRPFLLVGWLWYLGTLLPVIGLIQVGEQAMADRYTYLPLVGIFIGFAWGMAGMVRDHFWRRSVGLGLVALALLGCWVQTAKQLRHWRNSRSLFGHALAVTRNNSIAHNNYGIALFEAGETEAAAQHFTEALRIKPASLEALKNLGNLRLKTGRLTDAIQCYQSALRLDPADPDMEFNLANAFALQGEPNAAETHYATALRLRPDDADMRCVFGFFLAGQTRMDDAIAATKEAIRLRPGFAEAHGQLGVLFSRSGHAGAAVEELQRALKLKPDLIEARLNLGGVYETLRRPDEAESEYRRALAQQPDSPRAQSSLAILLARAGKPAEAASHFSELVRLEPNNADAHYNLANALCEFGQFHGAALHYAETLRLNPRDDKARQRLEALRREHPGLVPAN